jgi:ankyrin repeat protein
VGRASVGILIAVTWLVAACSGSPGPRSTTPSPEPSGQPAGASGPLALHEAAGLGDAARVRELTAAGMPVDGRDPEGRTALLLAVRADRLEVARVLVAAGASPDALDGRHDTPWLATGETGSVAMGRLLFSARPDLTIRNRLGGVALIPASERGHVDYVRWVVTTGIDVNHVNDLGWTALLEAVILGDGSARYQEIVRILVDAGARVGLPDRNGLTALDHARQRGQTTVAAILARG